MSIDEPFVIWGLGVVVIVVGALITRLDRRVASNRTDVERLKEQMAGHDANKETLDRMYIDLQDLIRLTSRIAGHLNIS